MENNLDFKVFLFISTEKLIISAFSEKNQNIYRKELIRDKDKNYSNFDDLDFFLSNHVFRIEKEFKNFVKKISIILETDDFLPIEISLKKNNYKNLVDLKNLEYLLKSGKDYCKNTIGNRKIVHMIIENYQIDSNFYSSLPTDIKANNFSIDVKIICISNNLIKNFEKIFKKYQITLGKILNANYVSKFLDNNEEDIFLMAQKIINGYNPNEVKFVEKASKNRGFYEKFFNFFN